MLCERWTLLVRTIINYMNMLHIKKSHLPRSKGTQKFDELSASARTKLKTEQIKENPGKPTLYHILHLILGNWLFCWMYYLLSMKDEWQCHLSQDTINMPSLLWSHCTSVNHFENPGNMELNISLTASNKVISRK